MKMNVWNKCLILLIMTIACSSAKRFVLKNTNDQAYNTALVISKRTVAIVQDNRGGWSLTGTCQTCSVSLTQGCTVCSMPACQKTVPWSSLICQGLNAKSLEKLRLAKTNTDVSIAYYQGKTLVELVFRIQD